MACCSIQMPDQPMCCDMSPDGPLLAVGLISGGVHVHSLAYDAEQKGVSAAVSAQQQWGRAVHGADESCRAVRWLPGSQHVISGAADKKLVASSTETGKQVWQIEEAHDAGVSMLYVLPGGPSYSALVASGDEDGGLKLWDLRTRKQAMAFKKHKDFISDASLHPRDCALVVTSGDGTLSVHDLKALKFRARSEADADDELLSVAIVKGGNKVVAGSGTGVLAIYSWGYFNDCSDRFPGHPDSVDALVVWDDSTLLTGSSDGLIRAVNILPNKLLGVVGAHEELPVENLSLSHDRRFLASTSHDDTVRLWDLSILHDDGDEDGEDEEDGSGDEDGKEQGEGIMGQAGEEDADEDDEDDEWEEQEGDQDDGIGVRAPGAQPPWGPEDEKESGDSSSGDEEGEGDAEGEASSSESDGGQRLSGGGPAGGLAGKAAAGHATSGRQAVKVDERQTAAPGGEAGAAALAARAAGGGKNGTAAGGVVGRAAPVPAPQRKALQMGKTGMLPAAAGAGSDDDDDDSDGGGAGPRKGAKRQRERTRWTKEKNKKPTANFFSDLL